MQARDLNIILEHAYIFLQKIEGENISPIIAVCVLTNILETDF